MTETERAAAGRLRPGCGAALAAAETPFERET